MFILKIDKKNKMSDNSVTLNRIIYFLIIYIMTNAELVRALNQIHLEASVIETLLCQCRVCADEVNIRVLANVLIDVCADVDFDDINEQWCLEKLKALSDAYVDLCRKVKRSPTVIKQNPSMFPVLFNVLLRSTYKYLSLKNTEKIMTETAKMMVVTDKYLTEETFLNFIYWFEALNLDKAWEAAAKIPRVIKMTAEEMIAESHNHLILSQKGGGFPEA